MCSGPGLVAGEGAGGQERAAEAKPRSPHAMEFSASVQCELHGRLGIEGSVRLPHSVHNEELWCWFIRNILPVHAQEDRAF